MKIFKIFLLILLVVFVGIQFIPTKRNQNTTVPTTDFMMVHNVPGDIKNKLEVSCYDCHSNNTAYPWYNKIQPVALFLEGHIDEGKAELNFSEFGNYSIRKQKSKLKAISSQIKSDDMPLSSYTIIHKNAILTKENKVVLINWLQQLNDSLSKIN